MNKTEYLGKAFIERDKAKPYVIKHPLINAKATHYDTREKPVIHKMQDSMSLVAMQGAMHYNILKYSGRQKGQDYADIEKIIDCQRYLSFIEEVAEALGHILDQGAYNAAVSKVPMNIIFNTPEFNIVFDYSFGDKE